MIANAYYDTDTNTVISNKKIANSEQRAASSNLNHKTYLVYYYLSSVASTYFNQNFKRMISVKITRSSRLQAQLYKRNYAFTYALTYTCAHISSNNKKLFCVFIAITLLQ